MCKVFGRIIKNDTMDHMVEYSEINSQHRFTKGSSRLMNLLELPEVMCEKLDVDRAVDVIFLDLTKAFNKVPL